jgi:hypothetical protein
MAQKWQQGVPALEREVGESAGILPIMPGHTAPTVGQRFLSAAVRPAE